MGEYVAIIRVLKDIRLALPDEDVYLREGQIRKLPLKPALILSRNEYAEILSIEEVEDYDLRKSQSKDLAYVEG